MEYDTGINSFESLLVTATSVIEKLRISGSKHPKLNKSFDKVFCSGFSMEKQLRYGVTAKSHEIIVLGVPVVLRCTWQKESK